jgi:hypothetical protein
MTSSRVYLYNKINIKEMLTLPWVGYYAKKIKSWSGKQFI